MVQIGFELEEISEEISGVLAEIAQRLSAGGIHKITPGAITFSVNKMLMAYEVSDNILKIWTPSQNVCGNQNTLPHTFHPSCHSVEYRKMPDFGIENDWTQFTLII